MNHVQRPLDMNGAAEALGIARRTLTDALKRLPFYELRGRKKVFYPEHIARLRKELGIPDPESGLVADGRRRGIDSHVAIAVLDRDNRTCVYCGAEGQPIELDHLTPISRGGNDTVWNLVTSCRACNRQKGRKTLSEYIKWRADNGLPVYAMRHP